MKILIITNAFPPLNSIASLRPYSWAKYWSEAGHEICVLTTVKTSSSGWLDLKMDPEVEGRIRIVSVPFFVFDRRIKRGELPKVSNGTGTGTTRRIIRVLRSHIFGSFLDSRWFWIWPAMSSAFEIFKTWKYEIVVSTYDPPAAHIIASKIQHKLGISWIADYRDLWSDSHLEKPIFPLSLLQERLESKIIKRASLLTTVSEPLKNQLQERFKQKVSVIENGFDNDDLLGVTSSEIFPIDGSKRILYTGKINKSKQDPTPLFEALSSLSRQRKISKGQIEVLFFGQWLEHLPKMIDHYQLEGFVKVCGFMNRERILEMQKAADLLLFLDFKGMSVDGILTGKLFEYMASGTPVLGIGMDDKKAAAKLIQEAGIGLTFGSDPKPLEGFLMRFIQGERPYYQPKLEIIQRFTRRNLAEKMLTEMETVIQKRTSNG